MNWTIPELVERFIGGDTGAFTELVRLHQRRIYSVAFRLLGNHLDADEVVQETFVRVYGRRKELQHVASFTSFLMRIATNYAIDLLRKRKGRGSVGDDPATLPGNVQMELSRRVRTPSDDFDDRVLMKEILQALDRLPPRQRLTAILHDIEGYTKTEIAGILNCPEATVRSNLHIARTKLKKILSKRLSTKE
ncbi:MAG: RNA polymerase sigma factor [Candidatus Zixiibacteriota bacterium]